MGKTEEMNDNFTLIIPEGFSVLTDQDIQEMGKRPIDNDFAIRNEEAHLMFEIAWKKAPLLAKLVDLGQTASILEKNIAKMIPSFRKEYDLERTICGEKSCGFRYSYNVSDINMLADYFVLRHGKQYYYLLWLGRKETFEEYNSLFDSILENLKFR